ncbi:Protein of uncharacterised function (DUF1367) [Klebsiella pneumoniae]|uniref:Protein of uncharacterized function (DUF1367) n=1 Tax=Klebsiella pneumoniae TaxID=573 RepID=A0A377XE02_KLEPN|nr:Protein of uncharacterised function (DUF1367) [Klebsiella pneumoniae]
MAQTLQFEKSYQNVLIPAEPGTSEYLQLIPVGQLLCGEFRKPRNYAFHKKFFKLLTLGITTGHLPVVSLSPRSVPSYPGLSTSFHPISISALRSRTPRRCIYPLSGISRSRDMALLKHFESFREWATIQAGFYDEYQMPDGSRRRVAKSISFASMDDSQFNGVYKSVLNVLWNYILRRKFHSPAEAENAASQLLSFAG